MAGEEHFLAQMRRFRKRPKMGRYTTRQVVAIWKKVQNLPDESISSIIEHFLNSSLFVPGLDVWDELVAWEWRLIRDRRERAEKLERDRLDQKADEEAAAIPPEERRLRAQRIRDIIKGALADKGLEKISTSEE